MTLLRKDDEEKEILGTTLSLINEALECLNELDDDESHADIYWNLMDITNEIAKRIRELKLK